MKLKFNQYGQTLVLVANGEKFTSRIEDEYERNEKRDKIKEIFEKFNKSKSEIVKERIFKKLKALMVSDNTKKEKQKKENDKAAVKSIKKKISKSTKKDEVLASIEKLSQADKDDIIKSLGGVVNAQKANVQVPITSSKRRGGEY